MLSLKVKTDSGQEHTASACMSFMMLTAYYGVKDHCIEEYARLRASDSASGCVAAEHSALVVR